MKAIALFAFAIACFCAEPAWQTGKVTEVASQRFEDPIDDKGMVYTINSGRFNYIAAERSMAHHRLKRRRVEPGETVRFAIKGETTMLLIGDDGKERKLLLIKQSESDR